MPTGFEQAVSTFAGRQRWQALQQAGGGPKLGPKISGGAPQTAPPCPSATMAYGLPVDAFAKSMHADSAFRSLRRSWSPTEAQTAPAGAEAASCENFSLAPRARPWSPIIPQTRSPSAAAVGGWLAAHPSADYCRTAYAPAGRRRQTAAEKLAGDPARCPGNRLPSDYQRSGSFLLFAQWSKLKCLCDGAFAIPAAALSSVTNWAVRSGTGIFPR